MKIVDHHVAQHPELLLAPGSELHEGLPYAHKEAGRLLVAHTMNHNGLIDGALLTTQLIEGSAASIYCQMLLEARRI